MFDCGGFDMAGRLVCVLMCLRFGFAIVLFVICGFDF